MTTTILDGRLAEDGARPRRRPRLPAIDRLRGLALLAMAVYHFTWDLEYFGYVEPGTAGTGGWRLFARLIAGSFLFLAGLSLVLGHGDGVRARSFLVRLAKIAAAAALVTVGTWFAFRETFIFFGILHAIAAASVIGLLFLRLPAALTFAAAAAAAVAPLYLRAPLFDHPALWWVGLSTQIPRSNDYVPLLPWLAPFLAGIGAGRLLVASTIPARLAATKETVTARWKTLLAAAGRHSLAIYLIHQPVLIALLYGVSLAVPAPAADPVAGYRASCTRACEAERGAGFCGRFCECTLDRLTERNLFADLTRGAIDVAKDDRITAISAQCTADAETQTDLKE